MYTQIKASLPKHREAFTFPQFSLLLSSIHIFSVFVLCISLSHYQIITLAPTIPETPSLPRTQTKSAPPMHAYIFPVSPSSERQAQSSPTPPLSPSSAR